MTALYTGDTTENRTHEPFSFASIFLYVASEHFKVYDSVSAASVAVEYSAAIMVVRATGGKYKIGHITETICPYPFMLDLLSEWSDRAGSCKRVRSRCYGSFPFVYDFLISTCRAGSRYPCASSPFFSSESTAHIVIEQSP